MDKKTAPERTEQWLKDIPVRGETARFAAEEMLVCPKCGRRSPPTRAECFYCAADLPVNDAQNNRLRPNRRQLEDWEKGFNVVYLPKRNDEGFAVNDVLAERFGLEAENLEIVSKAGKVLPVARLETERAAEILRGKLSENGIDALIVADENLRLEIPNRRLRAVEFTQNKIVARLFNTDEAIEIAPENLRLIVVGAIFERKIESTESIKRKKDNKIKESAETSFDLALIDLYAGDDPTALRIETNGFDFSGLGTEKSLLAAENMRMLAEKLRRFAPAAIYDNDYKKLRATLSRVWAVEQRTDSVGVQRDSLGSFNRKNVTVINNSAQFNRYSRLRRNVL